MDPRRYQQVKSILMEALDAPPADRDRLLAARCGGDDDLRQEVEALLEQAEDDDFLEPTPPSLPDPFLGRSFAGYHVLRQLGEGGMGLVYLAEDERLRRRAALKFIRPELGFDPGAKARFIREAQATAALDHPNICPLYGVHEADGQLFMAMRFYEGDTIKERLVRGAIPVAESLDLAMQIASGLQAAHRAGIVHRDVKPGNILICEGVAKILDFGIAKVRDHAPLTIGGGAIGTANYMSPEQARGGAVDERSDIWALGIVLFEMVTGTKAAESEVLATVPRQRSRDPIYRAVPPGVVLPDEVVTIIRRATAPQPDDRYSSMGEVMAALDVARRGLPDVRPAAAPPTDMRDDIHVSVLRSGQVTWSRPFQQDAIVVGRAPRSDVVLDDPEVSWTHAVVKRGDDGGLVFTDQSSNGSFQQGRRVSTALLGRRGRVSIPPFELEVRLGAPDVSKTPRPTPTPAAGFALRFVKGPAAVVGRSFPLSGSAVTIGRAPDCDIVVDAPSISRNHAALMAGDGAAWSVEDKGSTNGVFVNGVAVTRMTLRAGDRVGFGNEINAVFEPVRRGATSRSPAET